MRLGQTSVIFLLSKITASVIGFLATVYFTRVLGEEIYGLFALSLAIVAWLGIFKDLGIGGAVVKRMSEDEEPDAFFAAGATIKGTLTILIVSVVLIFQSEVDNFVGYQVSEFIAILLIVTIFWSLVSNGLKGSHRVHIYAPLSTLKEILRSAIMVILVLIGYELTGMLVGYAIGTLLVATIGFLIIQPSFTIPTIRHFKRLVKYAKWSWLGSIRGRSFNDVDIVVLGFFVSTGFIGVYAVAWSLSKFLDIFTSAISNTLFPEMSKLATAGDSDLVAKLTEDALSFAGLFLIPGFVGAAILGEYLMRIYGPGFAIGDDVLWLLVAAILLYAYARQLLNTLNAIDRPDLAFRANAVFITANIILNVTLIYLYGWVGAAVATAISAGIALLMAHYYARQHVDYAIPYPEISRQGFAAVVMGLAVFGAVQVETMIDLMEWNIATVLLPVGTGAALYFLVYVSISRMFREVLTRNLPFGVPHVTK